MRQIAAPLTAIAVVSILIQHAAAQTGSVYLATLAEANQRTQEVSTAQVRGIVADGSAILLDTRSHAEYVAGHIPGAQVLKGPISGYLAILPNWKASSGATKAKRLSFIATAPFAGTARG